MTPDGDGWLDRWFQPPTDQNLDLETARRLALLYPTSFTLAVASFLAVLVATPTVGSAYAIFALGSGIAFALAQYGYSRVGSLVAAAAPLAVPYAGFLKLVDGQSAIESMWMALAMSVGVLLMPWRWGIAWVIALPVVSGALMVSAGVAPASVARVGGVLLVIGVATAFAAAALSHHDRQLARQHSEAADTQRALEVALAEAQTAAEAKDHFLAVLTHELRTPLTGVLGGARLLLEAPLTPEQRRTSEIIHRSGTSLLSLIDDLLDVSRLHAGTANLDIEEVDVLGVLEEQLQDLDTSGRAYVPLVYTGPSTAPPILADRRRLGQVLGNLLTNAAKFTREGHIALAVTVRPGQVGIHVQDTGPGIRGRDRERVFEAFEQVDSRRGGAGLGLSIARGLMEAMDGTLELDEQTRGTCFTAWLPSAGELDHSPPPQHGLSALVVHPVDALRDAMVRWMDGWGYHVVAAATMDQAGEWLTERDFDIMVLAEGQSVARLPRVPAHRVWIGRTRATPPGEVAVPAIVFPGALLTALSGDVLVDPDSGVTATPAPARLRARVLLAEDNAVNRMVLRGMLGALGCEVQVVENGRQAVDAALSHRFDLVLMDCQMPEMDGFEATHAIVARHGDRLPVVALTASASDDVAKRCAQAGMSAFLTKPVSLETLQREIALQLR